MGSTPVGAVDVLRATPRWPRRAQPLLGTLVEIAAPARDDAELRRWTAPAFARVAAFHAAMSFHDPASDVQAIARARAGDRLRLAPDTWATLADAVELEFASAGAFNVAIAPALVERGLLPHPAGATPPQATSAAAALRLLADYEVEVVTPLWIDLGGIAKGAAVDAAVDALVAAGAPAALVNAGGDLRAYGDTEHVIEVRHPAEASSRVPVARLTDGAFATTATTVVAGSAVVAPCGHARWLQDPVFSMSVAAPRCALADALTKVVGLLGPRAQPLLRARGAHALWIDAEGRVHHVD